MIRDEELRSSLDYSEGQKEAVVRQIKRCTIHQIISGSVAIQ